MSHPYFFAAVQCRDERAFQEVRTVGVVLLGAEGKFAEVRVAPLARKLGETADLTTIRAVLAAWQAELPDIAGRGPAEAMAWLNTHRRTPESVIGLAPPTVGVADDLAVALREITVAYTGIRPGGGGQSWPEKVITRVLRGTGLARSFQEQTLAADCVAWKFPYVHGRYLLHPVPMDQTTDRGVFDAAFHETGRFDELRRHHSALHIVAVAAEPTGRAKERALRIYEEHGIDVVPADVNRLTESLGRLGLLSIGEAK